MQIRTRILFLVFAVVSSAAWTSASVCDPKFSERAFHFPNSDQQDSVFLLDDEAFSDRTNILQAHQAWFEQIRPQILTLASGLAGQSLSSFTVLRNPADDTACIEFTSAEQNQEQAQAEEPNVQVQGISKKRRVFGILLSALGFVNPYAAIVGSLGAPLLLRSGSASNGPDKSATKSVTKKTDSTFRLEGQWWNELW